jgi:hypothetical protein
VRRRRDDLGQQLDGRDLERRIVGGCRCGHARAETQKQRAPGLGMQRQRQPGLSRVDVTSAATAFLFAIIDAEARHPRCVFDDAHGGHRPFLVADEPPALRHVDEAKRRSEQSESSYRESWHERLRSQPRGARQQRQIAEPQRQQRELRTKPG